MGGVLSCRSPETTRRKRRPNHLDYSVTIRLSEDGDTPDHVNFYSNSALGGTPPSVFSPDPHDAGKLHGDDQSDASSLAQHHHQQQQEVESRLPEPFPRDSAPLLEKTPKEDVPPKRSAGDPCAKEGKTSMVVGVVGVDRSPLPLTSNGTGAIIHPVESTGKKDITLNGHGSRRNKKKDIKRHSELRHSD